MKRIIKSFALIYILGIAGCSTPSKVDKGPIHARTFSFIQTQGKPSPQFATNNQQIHALVQSSIARSLARRQVARVEQGGEVTVAYLIITGNNAVTTSINDYFGYGRDAAELSDRAHTKYTDAKNPNYFEAGTLIIDIIDSKTWKVLKRGYATRELLRNPSAEIQAARLNEVVEEILAGVRFEP